MPEMSPPPLSFHLLCKTGQGMMREEKTETTPTNQSHTDDPHLKKVQKDFVKMTNWLKICLT